MTSIALAPVARRFAQLGSAAFDDAHQRGPQPVLDEAAHQRVVTLVERETPLQQGWRRSRWSCLLLAWPLLRERHRQVSDETVRPVPPPRDPQQQRQRLGEILAVCLHLSGGALRSRGDAAGPPPSH